MHLLSDNHTVVFEKNAIVRRFLNALDWNAKDLVRPTDSTVDDRKLRKYAMSADELVTATLCTCSDSHPLRFVSARITGKLCEGRFSDKHH